MDSDSQAGSRHCAVSLADSSIKSNGSGQPESKRRVTYSDNRGSLDDRASRRQSGQLGNATDEPLDSSDQQPNGRTQTYQTQDEIYDDVDDDDRRTTDNARYSTASPRDHLIQSLVPKDKYRLVCMGFTILGITTLLPWNFFITATDYWMYKFRKIDGDYNADEPHTNERTAMQTFFESYLAIAANVPMLFAMLINSLYAQKISQKKRLYVSLSVMLTIFALTTIFVTIDTDHMQGVFFGLTMFMVVVISLFSATFQAAIFGIVANFPNNCMHSMVNGQAVAGLLAVTIQMVSMSTNTGPITSGLWYFMASTIFLAFAILCYWLMDNDYSRYYLLRIPDEDELSTSLSVNLIESKHELLEALDDCWQMALSVVLAFWASLAVFPGVCVLVVPEHPNSSPLTGRFFVPITTFLLFNLGDLAGRMCSSFLNFPAHKKNSLLMLTISRAIIPLLIPFCNVVPRSNLPVLLPSDLIFPILVGLTAMTNGYVFSSAMLMASENSRKTRLELTGFVMAAALGVGLTLGSVSSTLLLRVI
jgi:equilibrative nucleoside transporter 1/2/3